MPFAEFRQELSWMRDKKSHGVDGLPAMALKRIGYLSAYKEFS